MHGNVARANPTGTHPTTRSPDNSNDHLDELLDQTNSELVAYSPEAVKAARLIYSFRRKRNLRFGLAGLFDDPAWDMLLILFIDEANGRTVPITSACIASGVPSTTALRWIGRLHHHKLVCFMDDKLDKRRRFVKLTGNARVLMNDLLSGFADSVPL